MAKAPIATLAYDFTPYRNRPESFLEVEHMRVLEFFLYVRMTDMGWPRKKGIFRRQYVDASLADITIEQGIL